MEEEGETGIGYDELSERVGCPTAGCHGYGVRDGAGDEEEEDGVGENIPPTYRCSACGKDDGFDARITARNRALRAVDDFWSRRKHTTPSATSRGPTPDVVVTNLRSSYATAVWCRPHPSSWYLRYTGDALVRALLDRAAAHPTDDGISPAATGDYAHAHSVLAELNKGCAAAVVGVGGPGPRRSELPWVMDPLGSLQNRYWAAKLELFLNPDPRRAVGELGELLGEYRRYYPPEHEVVDGLRRCIQSGFQ